MPPEKLTLKESELLPMSGTETDSVAGWCLAGWHFALWVGTPAGLEGWHGGQCG